MHCCIDRDLYAKFMHWDLRRYRFTSLYDKYDALSVCITTFRF